MEALQKKGMSWIEVQFLTKAVAELKASRQILKVVTERKKKKKKKTGQRKESSPDKKEEKKKCVLVCTRDSFWLYCAVDICVWVFLAEEQPGNNFRGQSEGP